MIRLNEFTGRTEGHPIADNHGAKITLSVEGERVQFSRGLITLEVSSDDWRCVRSFWARRASECFLRIGAAELLASPNDSLHARHCAPARQRAVVPMGRFAAAMVSPI